MKKYTAHIAITCLILLSLGSWYGFYRAGLTLAYNDAMSHLNLTRLMVDNKTPGLAQMGGVWLPANRLLSLPLIWNDFLFRTGLAGSLVSMLAYIGTVITLFQITFALTAKRSAAYVAALVAATNVSFLYLQSTPLTEPLFIFFFTLSIYTYVLWYKTQKLVYLFALAGTGFLQALTRYDGWFVVIATSAVIFLTEVLLRKSFAETLGKAIVYTLPAIAGILLWLLWCAFIFGNPLYFTQSEFSAKAQQDVIAQYGGLITKNNIPVSVTAYLAAAYENIGLYIVVVGGLGFLFLLRSKDKRGIFLTLLIALSPIIFNVITLVLGITFINVPQINWNPYNLQGEQWFNVRYGSLAIPLAALLLGYIAAANRSYVVVCLMFVIIQTIESLVHTPAVIKDGTIGASAFRNSKLSQAIKAEVKPQDTVLLSIAYYSPVAFNAEIPFSNVIHEGYGDLWETALESPTQHATLVVIPKRNLEKTPYTVLSENSSWTDNYQIVFQDDNNLLYKRNN